jgi:hypothetical protein
MNDYPPPQQPPFAGNAWYHAVIPEGDPLPEGAEDCGPTAGGQLIKFRWGPEVEYTATRPAWRYEVRLVEGRKVTSITMVEP